MPPDTENESGGNRIQNLTIGRNQIHNFVADRMRLAHMPCGNAWAAAEAQLLAGTRKQVEVGEDVNEACGPTGLAYHYQRTLLLRRRDECSASPGEKL